MIKGIELTRFRGHTVKYDFGSGLNVIKGPNEIGKSTIKEALAFGWMGTDSEGTKNPEHLISVGELDCEVVVKTTRAIIARRKKKGGATTLKFEAPPVPQVTMPQSDLMTKLGMSYELFMSCWLTGYFMKLKAEQRLKVLGEIAKIDRFALLKELVGDMYIPPQVKLKNPSIDATAIAGLRRADQNALAALEGGLQQLSAAVTSGVPDDFDGDAAQVELTALDDKIAAWEAYQAAVRTYSTAKVKYEEYSRRESEREESIKKNTALVESLRARHTELVAKRTGEKEKINAIDMEIAQQQARVLPRPVFTSKKPSLTAGTCSSCGQVISDELVKAQVDFWEKELAAFNQDESKVEQHNREIERIITDRNASKAVLVDSHNKLSQAIAETEGEAKSAQNILKELSTPAKAVPKPKTPPKAPEITEITSIKSQRDMLVGRIHSWKNAANVAKERAARIEVLNTQKAELVKKIAKYSELENALQRIPALETERTLEKVRIEGLTLSLEEEDLVIRNDRGVDYRSLSDGRKMKVDVSICMAIRAHAGPAAPPWIFIDNADLMDKLPNTAGVQTFVAEVNNELDSIQVIQM